MATRRLAQELGNVLREHRARAGLTQEELAAKAKLHPTYVSLLERGKRNATLQAIWSIAAAIGVPPSRLIKDVEGRIKPS